MCKEKVSVEHEERSSSLVQEEPEQPPHIKEEQEEDLERPEEADGLLISDVPSITPSGKNFITTDVKTLMFWSVDFHQINNTCERLLLGLGVITTSMAAFKISLYSLFSEPYGGLSVSVRMYSEHYCTQL